jgi:peptidoglycan hydrolase-like protein with peptidoglycan-binding domain
VRRSLVVAITSSVLLLAAAVLASVDTAEAAARKDVGRTLAPGATGPKVRQLQRLLTRAGYPTNVDGAFGPATTRSVRRFERDRGLRVDARVTPRDRRLLRQRARSKQAQPPAAAGTMQAPGTQAPPPEAAGQPPAPAAPVGEVPGTQAALTPDGLAIPPAAAPQQVKDVILAGNQIARSPYKYGGGHADWIDVGYDCSGSVSFALHGGGLLDRAMNSAQLGRRSGARGPGAWITVYGNRGHAYMVMAGLRFDTTARRETGSRWTAEPRSPAGYRVRHPRGL